MTGTDLIFLIGSYIIVSDGEINEKEHNLLNSLVPHSDEALYEQERIYSDSTEKLSLKRLLTEYATHPEKDLDKLFDALFQVEYADGYADPKEDEIIVSSAKHLGFTKSRLETTREKYSTIVKDATQSIALTWSESLSSVFKSLIYELKGSNEDEDDYSELLSGSSFAKKVKDIAVVSQHDLSLADGIMTEYNASISKESEHISKNIERLKQSKREDKEIQNLVEKIVETNEWISKDVQRYLSENLIVLDKKKRTINYFTIAFMGRTKAGKSTFHKVVTHEVNDDIGVGKLRTTRYNRSFYWENIRIVDTPGIGAPGGKTDTETASSIIDEADLICYIVTDDSIQTTEFDFLRPLKERSKPLFIILNIKGDLDHPKRLERFLADPLKWRTDKGKDDIQGHFDRIEDALGDKYDMSMVEVIPLQLYAAILMNQTDRFTEEEKAKLLLGSNIQEYVRKVKASIYKTGSLKKAQNIYDGCAYQVHQVRTGLQAKYDDIILSIGLVDRALESILAFIDKELHPVEDRVRIAISTAFKKLRNNAAHFSEQYYDCKEDLSSKWNNYPDNCLTYSALSNSLNKISEDFHNAIQDRISECLDDISIKRKSFYNISSDRQIKGERIVDVKFGVNILGALITGGATFYAGPILAFFVSNPVGWMTFVFTAVIGLITWGISSLFTSKEKKIAKAKEKLYNSLLESIEENEPQMLSDYIEEYRNKVEDLKDSLDKSFRFVSNESKNIAANLHSLIDISKKCEDSLVSLFIFRILQYLRLCGNIHEEDISANVIKQRIQGERQYEQSSLQILRPQKLPKEALSLASQITQIKINN